MHLALCVCVCSNQFGIANAVVDTPGVSRWEKPIAGAAAEPLPEGWIAVESADGTYYENTATGESQWEKPTA